MMHLHHDGASVHHHRLYIFQGGLNMRRGLNGREVRGAFSKWVLIIMSLLCNQLLNQAYARPLNITVPDEVSQDVFALVKNGDNKNLLTQDVQDRHRAYFLTQFFEPWDVSDPYHFYYVPGNEATCEPIEALERNTVSWYVDKEGYGDKYELLPSGWLDAIKDNMRLSDFPSCAVEEDCSVIMVDNAQLRALPIASGFYKDFTIPGEGYPFDYMALSDIFIGTPMQLIHTSADGKWGLIKGNGLLGWVPVGVFARVSGKFREQWRKNSFGTPGALQFIGNQEVKRIYTGTVLPMDKNNMLLPVRDASGNADTVCVSKKNINMLNWPLKPDRDNMAHQINALIGGRYGWGGKDFNSDCSGILRQLFASFGIWIPRNSYYQTEFSGKRYELGSKDDSTPEKIKKRKKVLIEKPENPVPFMTLVSFGVYTKDGYDTSHIGLYIGEGKLKSGKTTALIFHNVWGVGITDMDSGEHGRLFIGKAVISPIGPGESYRAGLRAKNWDLSSLWAKDYMSYTQLNEQWSSSGEENRRIPLLTPDDRVKRYIAWEYNTKAIL